MAEQPSKKSPRRRRLKLALTVFVFLHLVGLLSSLHAVMTVRTAQGTIAWSVSLNALPIVAMTSSTQQEDLLRSYAAGVNSCVRKPVDFDQFTRAVREIGMFWLLVNEVPESR